MYVTRHRFITWATLFIQRHALTLIFLFGAACFGAVIGYATPRIMSFNSYRLALLGLACAIFVVTLISSMPRHIMTMGVMFAFTINLAFTPFTDDLPEHAGGALPAVIVYPYDLPLLALIAIWILDIIAERRPFYVYRPHVLGFLWVIWSMLTLFNAVDPALTLWEAFRMFKLFLLSYILTQMLTNYKMEKLVIATLVGGLLLQGVFTAAQYFAGADLSFIGGYTVGSTRRVSGTVGWPNTLGAYAASALMLIVAYWVYPHEKKWRWRLPALMLFGSLPLLLSFSRGAWLSAILGIAALYGCVYLSGHLRSRNLTQLGAVLAAIVAIGLFFAPQIAARFAQDTVSVRWELNNIALRMVNAEPIVGIGLNNFLLQMPNYDPSGIYYQFREPVHNIYLLILAETGIVGLFLFAMLNIQVLWLGIRVLRQPNHNYHATMAGLMAALVALLFSNIFDVHIKFDPLFVLYWTIIGTSTAIIHLTFNADTPEANT